MINVNFFVKENRICGFEISGHSGMSARGSDILCAAVSSAAYMTANTLTEVLHGAVKADVNDDDGYMKIMLFDTTEKTEIILKGFQIHINALAKDYRKNLKVIYGGAENA